MSDLFGNHIVGFPTRRLNYFDREQLDKEIAKTAESVATELQGDPVKTKTELLSQTKKMAKITMEQKLGKAPKTKTDLLSRIKQQAEIKMAQKLVEVPHGETAEQKVSKATKLAESTGGICHYCVTLGNI